MTKLQYIQAIFFRNKKKKNPLKFNLTGNPITIYNTSKQAHSSIPATKFLTNKNPLFISHTEVPIIRKKTLRLRVSVLIWMLSVLSWNPLKTTRKKKKYRTHFLNFHETWEKNIFFLKKKKREKNWGDRTLSRTWKRQCDSKVFRWFRRLPETHKQNHECCNVKLTHKINFFNFISKRWIWCVTCVCMYVCIRAERKQSAWDDYWIPERWAEAASMPPSSPFPMLLRFFFYFYFIL